MATKYVRELLLDEIIKALGPLTKPSSGYIFNYCKRGELLGNQEPVDSAVSPGVIVEWPTMTSCTPVTRETSNSIYTTSLFIHMSYDKAESAEKKASECECKIRVAITSYSSAALKAAGYGCGNNVSIESIGWVKRGQDLLWQINLTFDLYVPATQLVDA